MPIQNNKQIIRRIKYLGKDIRRVYRGKELQYGLYDIIYNYDKEHGGACTEKPSQFIWGEESALPTCTHTEATDWAKDRDGRGWDNVAVDVNYPVACEGWYEDIKLTKNIDKINNNTTENKNLYQKLVQTKLKYKYTWEWDEYYDEEE